ncbi:hypothetical protein [Thomasclavelia cocleata]|uniref:hypothetical protein n=1 Tax=Thomasclavelia cocleata TaxID=69824 RepID=UPI002432FBC5|nr:hypothetical protein [Thomasclavelia cocleata]
MANSKNCIDGLENLKNDLKKASKNISNNSDEVQLLIDYDLVLKNVSTVNNMYGSIFSVNSTEDDINNFFSNAYADILVDNLFSSNLDVVEIFNDKFNPYAKVE